MSDNFENNYGYTNGGSIKAAPALEVKGENVLLGVVGALIGALAGAALIVLLEKVGYVASISGVVMAFLSLFLYEKFAGKLSVKGVIICCVIMVVTVFATEWLVWSYYFHQELKVYGFTFMEVVKGLPDFLELGDGEAKGAFIRGILMVYAFTALGAVPQIRRFAALNKATAQVTTVNTIQNSVETVNTDENEVKKFDKNFFN